MGNNSSIISSSVFIVTTMACALFTYLTGRYEKTLTKISKKVQNLENNLAKVETIALNYEHVLFVKKSMELRLHKSVLVLKILK